MVIPTLTIILEALAFGGASLIFFRGYTRKLSLYKILLQISIAEFVFEFLVVGIIAFLSYAELDLAFNKESVSGSLIAFLCWFYFIPPSILIVAIFRYLYVYFLNRGCL